MVDTELGKVIQPKIRILTVDDFPTMRKIIRNLLKQIGYENVIEADDGATAKQVLERNDSIEFIISDWNMPQMTGLELLKWVRSNPKVKHLPFLMITAEAEKDNIVEAVKAGVSNYIVKPFSAAVLKGKIDKILTKGK